MSTIQPEEDLLRKLIREEFKELHLAPNEETYYTAREAAAILKYSIHTLYQKTSRKLIPHYKKYGRVLFRRMDLFVYQSKKKHGGTGL